MTIQPSPFLPPLVHAHRHADNGFSPDAAFYGAVVAGIGHLVAFRRKVVYRMAVPLGTAGGITGEAWRWYSRSGVGAKRFVVFAVLGLDDRNIAVDPYIAVTITKVSDASTTTMEFHGGESRRAATDAPEEFIPFLQTMDVEGDEVYTGAVEFNNNVRVIALMVWEDSVPEADDSNPPHSEWSPSAGSPIYDGDIGAELDGVGDMLRRNGGLRWDWHPVDGVARTRLSATYINLIDNSSASPPTAQSPGVKLNTTARRTVARNQVNVRLAVWGSVTGGTGTVKLRSTVPADAVTVTINNATPQWFTATGAVTVGSGQKYDLMFAGDGSNTVSVLAVSLFEEG